MLITRFHSIVLSRARERRRYNHLRATDRNVSVSMRACVRARVCVWVGARGWDRARERDETTCGNNVSEEILG